MHDPNHHQTPEPATPSAAGRPAAGKHAATVARPLRMTLTTTAVGRHAATPAPASGPAAAPSRTAPRLAAIVPAGLLLVATSATVAVTGLSDDHEAGTPAAAPSSPTTSQPGTPGYGRSTLAQDAVRATAIVSRDLHRTPTPPAAPTPAPTTTADARVPAPTDAPAPKHRADGPSDPAPTGAGGTAASDPAPSSGPKHAAVATSAPSPTGDPTPSSGVLGLVGGVVGGVVGPILGSPTP